MKAFAIAAAALCSLVAAAPIEGNAYDVNAPPPANATIYNIQAKSYASQRSLPETLLTCYRSTAAVNNLYLILKGTTGAFTLSSTGPAKFFTTDYPAQKTLSFHNADDTHQLALQGPNGTLLTLVDVVNPTGTSIPAGQQMEWSTFTMDGTNNIGVNDGSKATTRKWVAVPASDGSYNVALYDGKSIRSSFGRNWTELIDVQASATRLPS